MNTEHDLTTSNLSCWASSVSGIRIEYTPARLAAALRLASAAGRLAWRMTREQARILEGRKNRKRFPKVCPVVRLARRMGTSKTPHTRQSGFPVRHGAGGDNGTTTEAGQSGRKE